MTGLRKLAGGLLVLCLCAGVAVIPAAGAIPKNDQCWGTCGGDAGPVHGYFQTSNRNVIGFEDEQKCLGKQQTGQGDVFGISKTLPVTSAGTFLFTGKAAAYIKGVKTAVPLSLEGRFTTATSASITLKIAYAGCTKQVQLTINAD